MRLETLTFGAFGPFANEVTIDFRALGADGLFLLEGPTGAGKSTVIDAITFALYGKTAGERAAGRSSLARVTSDWAAPGTEPFAELTFATKAGTRFRVRRSPSHERQKQHGDGTTTSPPSARIWQLEETVPADDGATAPAERLIASRIRDVEAEVEQRLVGLTYDQFTQVVVLPQGEFSRFLRATPDDRAQVLRRLFGTEIFDSIANELEKRRDRARTEEGENRGELGRAAAGFAEAARLPDEHAEALSADDYTAIDALVTEACAEIAIQAEVTRHREEELRAAATAATEQLTRARSLAAICDRRDRARAEIKLLDAGAGHHASLVRERDALRQADAIRPSHDALTAARRQRLASAARWEEKALAAELAPDTGATAVEDAFEDATQSSARLAQLAERETELERDRVALAADQERGAALAAEIPRLDKELERKSGEVGELERRLAEVSPRLGAVDQAKSDLTLARHRAEAARSLVDARARLGEVEAAALAHEADARAAAGLAEGLRSAYLDDIAGQLAIDLEPGTACPVCGSIEHPAPAEPPASPVSRGDCATADEQTSDAFDALESALASVAAAREYANQLAVECGDIDPATADTQVADATAALALAEDAGSQHAAVQAELRSARGDLADIEETLVESHSNLAALTERVRISTRSVEDLDAKLRPHRGKWASIDDHLAAVVERRDALDAARSAHQAHTKARDAVVQAKGQFQALLGQAGIADEPEFVGLAARLAGLQELEVEIISFERRRAAAEAVLLEDDVAAAHDAARPDEQAAARLAAEAESLHELAITSRDTWQERAAAAARAATKVRAAWSDLVAAKERARPVVRLADIVAGRGGGNLQRLPLATYVLVTRFRRVVEAANQRLSGMLDGHFLLEEHQDLEGGARYSGLGLRVRDVRTETVRDVRTLSGGETFCVALALALGLADVVVAEAGGRALGTLFIDEGFGSLGTEALDGVMAEVSQLRRADRVVGIVSHVEDLKQRIPNRVEVRPGQEGSSTIRVIPGH